MACVISGDQYAQTNYAGHQQYNPMNNRYSMQAAGNGAGTCTSNNAYTGYTTCVTGNNVEPSAYYPYTGGNSAAAFDAAYPNEMDMSSTYPRGSLGNRARNDGSGFNYTMSVDNLMPAAWRSNGYQNVQYQGMSQDSGVGCDGGACGLWSQYAPSRQAFDRYITAGGSARLSLSTRDSISKLGMRDPLRPQPPMPLAAENVVFNDSSHRLDQIYQASGSYPRSTAC